MKGNIDAWLNIWWSFDIIIIELFEYIDAPFFPFYLLIDMCIRLDIGLLCIVRLTPKFQLVEIVLYIPCDPP